ncbi:MAG: NifB/NifX family molybdenum-iron cluster-binding protein [Campylobacterota bacterium]|nr:NifB/NifX family molybdenum-iron cluster-binding protein [Campylobacterota bacterium]
MIKIAIPVDSDKQTIIKRTGQAIYFAIYEDTKVVDYVKNNHGHGEHGKGEGEGGAHHKHEHLEDKEHISSHKKDIMGLVGCDVILVQAVGEHMKEALDSIGLKVKKIRKKDGATADEAVKNFLDNNI